MTNARITAPEVCRLLAAGKFDLTHEAGTQAAIEIWLRDRLPEGVSLEREFSLCRADRPDFFIDGRIVLEVKVKGSKSKREIWAQLERYAKDPRVTDIILATNVSMGLPSTVRSKDVRYVSLGRAWL